MVSRGRGALKVATEFHSLNWDDGYVSICFIRYMCFMVAVIMYVSPLNKR